MFHLFRSQAKAVRILLGALLGVMALSMLLYLIPGTGITAADSSADQVVAEIGKSTVTVAEVQQQLKNDLQNRRLPPSTPLPLFLNWWMKRLPSEPWLTKRSSSVFAFRIVI